MAYYYAKINRIIKSFIFEIQKQQCRGVLKKRCTENMQQIIWKKPMPKCDFNKNAKQLY